MDTPSPDAIAHLLGPYLGHTPTPADLYAQLQRYLALIVKWNGRTNLTAVRDPGEIVRRHFGESLFLGAHLFPESGLPDGTTLLDFGSGAGFPGIPMQLLRPTLAVTLAESQGKKAAFLREAVRSLGLSTGIVAARVESLPAPRRFDIVALRAVDQMETALTEAGKRATSTVAILGSTAKLPEYTAALPDFAPPTVLALPSTTGGAVITFRRC